MVRDEIVGILKKVTGEEDIHLETPELESHGDYSSNVAMRMFGDVANSKHSNPRNLAKELVVKLLKSKKLQELIDRIEVAGPGFINFWVRSDYLVGQVGRINEEGQDYGNSDSLKGKRYLIEHTSPNTVKTLHVGHVRNNVVAIAVHNLLEKVGAKVTLDAINNDRGIHVMKAVWAYQKYGDGKTPDTEKMKPDKFVDQFYAMGVKEEDDTEVKEQMRDLLRKWESGDKEVISVWKRLRDWTFEGFLETYKRLGSKHDFQWFESDFWKEGAEIVRDGLKKGVFKKLDDGAVLTDLAKYKLSDTIVLRSDGTSMYHTQDLRLTQLKREKFPSDMYLWCIGPEQVLYLKQLFAMAEQLGIGKREDYYHLSYGFVQVGSGGKMSSRKGNVVSADWLLDTVLMKAKKLNGDPSVSEKVALAAIKYGFLKLSRNSDVKFDIDESLVLQGNSGPYLQYTVARTSSVLAKIKKLKSSKQDKPNIADLKIKLNMEEESVLRHLAKFGEVVEEAAGRYAPNIICNYLYDLASKYNTFYNKHRIINQLDNDSVDQFRVEITEAVGTVLKNGLCLLGIQAPERM